MTKQTIPTAYEFDDLIARLERDLAWQNVRLENCKQPDGTLAVYLRKRIAVIGYELTETRRARTKYHGKAPESPKLPHRINSDIKAARLSTNRVDGNRKTKQRANSGKPNQNRH